MSKADQRRADDGGEVGSATRMPLTSSISLSARAPPAKSPLGSNRQPSLVGPRLENVDRDVISDALARARTHAPQQGLLVAHEGSISVPKKEWPVASRQPS